MHGTQVKLLPLHQSPTQHELVLVGSQPLPDDVQVETHSRRSPHLPLQQSLPFAQGSAF
jgi:hypothetical protein